MIRLTEENIFYLSCGIVGLTMLICLTYRLIWNIFNPAPMYPKWLVKLRTSLGATSTN